MVIFALPYPTGWYSFGNLRGTFRHVSRRVILIMKKPVKVYSLSTCRHCKSTKKLLSQCQVEYDVTDVDMLDKDEREAVLNDIRKLNPKCTFPTVIIGDKTVVGYKEDEIKEALGYER